MTQRVPSVWRRVGRVGHPRGRERLATARGVPTSHHLVTERAVVAIRRSRPRATGSASRRMEAALVT
eukprot:2132596-Prymnesium_polylepis.1